METLKNAEKPVGIGHIETDAVVANEKDYPIVAGKGADFDDGPRTRATELDCIGEETGKELFDELGVAVDGGQWLDAPFDSASFGVSFEAGHYGLNERSQRSGLEFQLVPGELGKS